MVFDIDSRTHRALNRGGIESRPPVSSQAFFRRGESSRAIGFGMKWNETADWVSVSL
jgi:hypothetical protein